MFQFLQKWFGNPSPKPIPKLSKEQALRLAKDATAQYDHSSYLYVVDLIQQEGKLVWVVGSNVRGDTVEVLVDDAAGRVIVVKYFPGR